MAVTARKSPQPFWTLLFITGLLFALINALGSVWLTSVGYDASIWRNPSLYAWWGVIAAVCVFATGLRVAGHDRLSSALICVQFAPAAAFGLWFAYVMVT